MVKKESALKQCAFFTLYQLSRCMNSGQVATSLMTTKKHSQLTLATGVNGRLSALTDEEKVKLMPLLMEPDFMNFLTEVIPCLYGEVENGRLVQNELTAETASLAPWFGDLIDIGFFSDLFYEFNRSRAKVPQDRKKPQQKS